jgi:hypothetical protein
MLHPVCILPFAIAASMSAASGTPEFGIWHGGCISDRVPAELGGKLMAARSEARTRSRRSAIAGDPPSSAGRAPLPPADEDDGFFEPLEDPLFSDDDDRLSRYGTARLGIP